MAGDADEDVAGTAAQPPKLPLNIIIFLLCDVSDRTEGLPLCQRHLNLDQTNAHTQQQHPFRLQIRCQIRKVTFMTSVNHFRPFFFTLFSERAQMAETTATRPSLAGNYNNRAHEGPSLLVGEEQARKAPAVALTLSVCLSLRPLP